MEIHQNLNGAQSRKKGKNAQYERVLKIFQTEELKMGKPSGNSTSPKLWAHCVSQHAAIVDPETSFKDLMDYHEHEHDGPCTIRNHDRADRTYSIKKIGQVLSESET
jgi:hypothetical protein